MSFWQKHIRPQWTFYAWGLVISIVLLSFLVWWLQPKHIMRVAILDKTVLTTAVQEHISFNWVLHHENVQSNLGRYSPEADYFGFKPQDSTKFFLDDFKADRYPINYLADQYDFVYFTDTYGIYHNEWYKQGDAKEHSEILYGGTTVKEAKMIEAYWQKRKPLILEFNVLATPTRSDARQRIERTVGVRYTGWTGRVFDQLDTNKNPELPRWVVRQWRKSHNMQPYQFSGAGIVLVHDDGDLDILTERDHLKALVPLIKTPSEVVDQFGLQEEMPYPFWFDICLPKDSTVMMATYHLATNPKGDSILAFRKIPRQFPAFMRLQNRSNAYYFCGDWADNPIEFWTTYFAGSQWISYLFYSRFDDLDRRRFFWRYYRPLVTTILTNSFDAHAP